MIRNILNVVIVIFIFFFLFFVISTYLSDKNVSKIKSNRLIVEENIEKSLTNLPVLESDTKNVIEFNSGYSEDNSKIKRNFWDLFKK